MNDVPRKSLKTILKENLFLGLVTALPLIVTLWVLISVVLFVDRAIYAAIPGIKGPEDLFGYYLPGLGLLTTFLLILLAGTLARTLVGRVVREVFESLLSKLPFVGGLYSAAKQISSAFFSQSPSRAFKRVVIIPFPSRESRSLGFVAKENSNGETFVFVPTAPNPTSGYVLIYKNEELEESSMSVDEALQVVISCGALGSNPHLVKG